MALRIFIGWDSRFPEPARVLAYTLRKRSSIALDIRFLDYRHLRDCYGFNRREDPLASTEFTYSRFLVPHLCDYDGAAVFMDNDMICLKDAGKLLIEAIQMVLTGKALAVVKHDHQAVDQSIKMYGAVQTAYPRKNWSSLMIMNCTELRCWTKEVVETASGARLHRFEDIPDDKIVSLDPAWNVLVGSQEHADPAILHFTEGGPWYLKYQDCPHAELWRRLRNEAASMEHWQVAPVPSV